MRWPWRKLGGMESGFVCAAMAATGFAIWKKDDILQENRTNKSNLKEKAKSSAFNTTSASNAETYNCKLKTTIAQAKDLCQIAKDELGLPGLSVAVSVNGKMVWEEGLGYSDVENRVPMKASTITRIASISKSMTMAMLAKLMEDDKINLDCPIQTYLADFPKKVVDGEEVTITTRQLLSHLSGIRHYEKKGEKPVGSGDGDAEFYMKEKCASVEKALEIFKNDELMSKPGTKYHYTTHGWTVVSAIIEKLTATPFPTHSRKMFSLWGLRNTYLDENAPLIYQRSRYYCRDKRGRLINSPYVDNSCKWAGGGFQSNVTDLIQFAHILLASLQYQENDDNTLQGLLSKTYLKRSTVQQLWTPNMLATKDSDSHYRYGMGFLVAEPFRKCLFCEQYDKKTVTHSGGAVGASSILLFTFPKDYRFGLGYDEVDSDTTAVRTKSFVDGPSPEEQPEIKGIVIAMITNLTGVSLARTANEIVDLFEWMT